MVDCFGLNVCVPQIHMLKPNPQEDGSAGALKGQSVPENVGQCCSLVGGSTTPAVGAGGQLPSGQVPGCQDTTRSCSSSAGHLLQASQHLHGTRAIQHPRVSRLVCGEAWGATPGSTALFLATNSSHRPLVV